jgi:hypothetical protein
MKAEEIAARIVGLTYQRMRDSNSSGNLHFAGDFSPHADGKSIVK